MASRNLSDIYSHALRPAALGLGHMYQANPSWPWYNCYKMSSKGQKLRQLSLKPYNSEEVRECMETHILILHQYHVL